MDAGNGHPAANGGKSRGNERVSDRTGRDTALWEAHMRQWNLLGPPLRPSAEDLRLFQREIDAWREAHGATAAAGLVLGVTPELPALQWPAGSRVFAADNSVEMIAYVWYLTAPFAAGAVAARWQALPFREGSIDVALGDGCFTLCEWPAGYAQFGESVRRVLAPGGRLVIRVHLRPGNVEAPEVVLAELRAGRIASFNSFKWRLLVALHGERADGIRLHEVWEYWRKFGIGEDALAEQTGWPAAVIRTIHAYRDKSIVYFFPTLAEMRAVLAPCFREIACHRPDYDCSDLHRVFVLEALR